MPDEISIPLELPDVQIPGSRPEGAALFGGCVR